MKSYSILSKTECQFFLMENSPWQRYEEDFRYHQKFFAENWAVKRMRNLLELQKKIKFVGDVFTRIIKLSISDKLPTHNFDYSNQDCYLKNTTFTIVTSLNDNYEGGNYFVNELPFKLNVGDCLIFDRTTTQSLSEIEKGECYLLFTHFGQILPNKIF